MTHDEKKAAVIAKLDREMEMFRQRLLAMSSSDILVRARDLYAMEAYVDAFDRGDLSDRCLDFILSTENPLSLIVTKYNAMPYVIEDVLHCFVDSVEGLAVSGIKKTA